MWNASDEEEYHERLVNEVKQIIEDVPSSPRHEGGGSTDECEKKQVTLELPEARELQFAARELPDPKYENYDEDHTVRSHRKAYVEGRDKVGTLVDEAFEEDHEGTELQKRHARRSLFGAKAKAVRAALSQ